MALKWKLLGYVLIIFLSGCKEKFEPNIPARTQNHLVVEGFINANGPTRIKLSRTVPLSVKRNFVPELNARVWVESDDNTTPFVVPQKSEGVYASGALPINAIKKYRIRITTSDNKEYVSSFVPVKQTPAIDSISWKQEDGGVRIYANTHDPANNTRYYQWDFDETWEINSAFFATYLYDNGNIRPRRLTDPAIYYCWKYASSNAILIGSSAKLEADNIYHQPIHFINRQAERLGIRYSILVRQYALEKTAYEFFEQMKKNTESLGTIFDPQPSALRGNIQCINDPAAIAIGYISASNASEKRIFIADRQLTGGGFQIARQCFSREIPNHPDSIKLAIPTFWPFDVVMNGPTIVKYIIAPPECVDCRLRAALNEKPSYW
ncbi:MAG TPA: DUF4249 domain-containing protein [Chitinophagaceae bacterium]|nr:DUF4249 domain-containing protein [Chitinophagaceae bacterium]